MLSVEPKNLISLLSGVAQYLSDKEYGWEEAILDNKWYHYPGEIKKQRFCSEEALKNYLLLRALQVPALYTLAHNYDNRGMAHEIIIVPDGDKTLMLEWGKVEPVTLSDGVLKDENGEILSEKARILPEEYVFSRVKKMRNGTSFMDAITSGQILYQSGLDFGNVDAYVKYNPKTKTVKFLYLLEDVLVPSLKFYFDYDITLEGRELKTNQECGVARNLSGLNFQKIPVFKPGKGMKNSEFLPFFDHLNEDEKRSMLIKVLYGKAAKEDGLIYSESERSAWLLRLEEAAESVTDDKAKAQIKSLIDIYNNLKSKNVNRANRYMDGEMSYIATCQEMPDINTFILKAKIVSGLGSLKGLEFYFSSMYLADISKFLSLDNILLAQEKLMDNIGRKLKVKVDYNSLDSLGLLGSLEFLKSIKPDHFWEKRAPSAVVAK